MSVLTTASGADDILSALTYKWVSSQWTPLFGNLSPLFTKLMNTRGKTLTGWGAGLRFPVARPASGPATVDVANSASAYAALTFTDTTFATTADYTPYELVRPVAVQNYDYERCQGDVAKLNWVNGVMKANLAAVKQGLLADLWATPETTDSAGGRGALASIRTLLNGAGQTTTKDGLTPVETSLQVRVSDSNTRAVVAADGQAATYLVGGINRDAAGQARWCTPVIVATQVIALPVLASIYRAASCDGETPDLAVTTAAIFDKIQSIGLLMGSAWPGFQKGSLAEFGWQTMRYLNMEIVYDENVPTAGYQSVVTGSDTALGHQMFAINTDHMFFWRDKVEPTMEVVPSDGRPIKKWVINHKCQLTSDNLGRVHAVHAFLGTS